VRTKYQRKRDLEDITIKRDILEGVLAFVEIQTKHDIPFCRVKALYDELIESKVLRDSKDVPVYGIVKRTKSYFTEEELLYPSSPFYGATNKQLLTSVHKDWKIYKYETEQEITKDKEDEMVRILFKERPKRNDI
jgi:hypothetical protein